MPRPPRSFRSALTVALLAVGTLLTLSSRAHADIPYPIRIAVVFEQGGQPYTGPVRFTITCYGYSYRPGPDPGLEPGSYTPEPVYSLDGACAGPGCTVDEDMYLNYRHIDRCDLAGSAGGVPFLVENYASRPIDFDTCGAPSGADDRSPCALRVAIPEDVALPQGPPGIAGPTGRSYVVDFLIALVLTLLIELPVLWVLARGVFKLPVSTRRLLAVGALGSLLTLPVLWFVLPVFMNPPAAIALGEVLAVGVEALLLWRLLPARPLAAVVLSLAANLASFLLGQIVF